MVNNPLILDANTVLVYVPKVMIVASKTPCLQLQRSLLKYYHQCVIAENASREKRSIAIPRMLEEEFTNLVKNHGYPKAEALFNSSKSETLRKLQLQLLKSSIRLDLERDKPSGMTNLQTNKLREFFLSTLFSLPQNH
jgi:hypothetical protein